MSGVLTALAAALMIVGALFMMIGSIGIIRLPDFYCRAHATGKVDTLGVLIFMLGLVVHTGLSVTSLKLLLLIGFVMVTSPVTIHALAQQALQHGVTRWDRGKGEAD
jgi:multicomponent Na+:H+ antiporter subunit G